MNQFSLSCLPPWGGLCDVSTTGIGANLVSDILIETRGTAGGGETYGASLASACSCTQGTSSYYTLIGRGTTADLFVHRRHVFWSFVHTPMISAGRIFYSPEFFSLILIYSRLRLQIIRFN